jgi:hypothetical protein
MHACMYVLVVVHRLFDRLAALESLNVIMVAGNRCFMKFPCQLHAPFYRANLLVYLYDGVCDIELQRFALRSLVPSIE